jgi:hypothetical protein
MTLIDITSLLFALNYSGTVNPVTYFDDRGLSDYWNFAAMYCYEKSQEIEIIYLLGSRCIRITDMF